MSFTFTTLKTAVQEYMDNDESTFTSNLTNFIVQSENRVFNTIELNVFRKNVTGTATSGSQYLGAPSDFISPMSLAVLDSDSKYTYLLLKHVSFMRNYIDTAATTGVPKYYAQFDDNTFIISPTPNANLTFELHYLYQPQSITETSDGTSWLGTNAPDLLLYGSLVEASTFMKQDLTETTMFETRFQENLVRLKTLMEGRATHDENRYDRTRVPIAPTAPQ